MNVRPVRLVLFAIRHVYLCMAKAFEDSPEAFRVSNASCVDEEATPPVVAEKQIIQFQLFSFADWCIITGVSSVVNPLLFWMDSWE